MSKHENGCGQPKWWISVNDVPVPMPRAVVPVAVIRAQSGIGDDFALVRDHNSPNDAILSDDDSVDLKDGNVFYSMRRCDVLSRGRCNAPAKMALFVDDRVEIVTRPDQTGKTIRQLFNVGLNVQLFRDLESSKDVPIDLYDAVVYENGPVFFTRQREDGLKITVNARVFTEDDGVKPEMTGGEIAALVYPEKPKETCVWLTLGEKRLVEFAESIGITLCATFDVVRKGVTGGYDAVRVQHEVDKLIEGGAKVSLSDQPFAVLFHELSVKPGLPVAMTDVLVLVPGGYPGQMLDGAYLPHDSLLLGRVKGSPQEQRVIAFGQTWKLVSYHPHTNGIGPAWDPSRHGIHTYFGEIMSWLHDPN